MAGTGCPSSMQAPRDRGLKVLVRLCTSTFPRKLFAFFVVEMPHISQDWLPERVESISHLGILLVLFPNRCEIWHFLRFGEGGLFSLENYRPKEALWRTQYFHIFSPKIGKTAGYI